jgi:hypothetical protein
VSDGHSSASACAPDEGTARTAERRSGRARRRGEARCGVREQKQFAESVFKIDFLLFSETKVHLAQNSKDVDQVFPYKICKGR